MLITNKAQYTCHKTFIWLRESLTCCTYVLRGGWYFPLINQHLLRGGQKNAWDNHGGFHKMKGKNKEIVIAHPLDKLWMLPKLNGSKVTAAMCKAFQRVSVPFLSSPSKTSWRKGSSTPSHRNLSFFISTSAHFLF